MHSNLWLLQCLLFMDFGGKPFFDFTTKSCFSVQSQTNIPYCNLTCSTQSITQDEMAQIKKYFGDILYFWFVDTNDFKGISLLEKNGLIHKFTLPAMVLNLDKAKKETYFQGIQIIKATSAQQQKTWQDLLNQRLCSNHSGITPFINYIKSKNAKEINFYLAYYFDQPVGTCMTVQHDTVITVHFLGVLTPYRNKGIGFALTNKALTDAYESGFKKAILIASDMAKNLYKNIGFVEYATYKIYGN